MSNRRKLRQMLPSSFLRRPPAEPATFWNGEPVPAVKTRVVVADAPHFPGYWARPLVGEMRDAVRVTYAGRTFYLDNADGSGWRKVTDGRGSPRWGHGELAVEREVFEA